MLDKYPLKHMSVGEVKGMIHVNAKFLWYDAEAYNTPSRKSYLSAGEIYMQLNCYNLCYIVHPSVCLIHSIWSLICINLYSHRFYDFLPVPPDASLNTSAMPAAPQTPTASHRATPSASSSSFLASTPSRTRMRELSTIALVSTLRSVW